MKRRNSSDVRNSKKTLTINQFFKQISTQSTSLQPQPGASAAETLQVQSVESEADISNENTSSIISMMPLPFEQHIPAPTFKFPRDKYKRCCRYSWFMKFAWLHYVQEKDRILCFPCTEARRLGKHGTLRGNEDAFITIGFSNWKKAIQKLTTHEATPYHRESINFLHNIRKRTSVASYLDKALADEQKSARIALRLIVSSIRYLARSGQAFRGQESDDGNLVQLLEERALDSPELAKWLKRRDKWMSGDIQNEILEILAHNVQRKLVNIIADSPFYSIMGDGTTDITGDEQFSTCIRTINPVTFEVMETFMGLYCPIDGKAETLHNTLNDIIIRLGLSIDNLRGHCFDGARVMAGNLNGVQKRIADQQPKSLFVHCSNHSLDLVLQEVARKCEMIPDTLSMVKDVSNAILDSSKRKKIYEEIVLPPCVQEAGSRLLALCPTRWCVRVKSLSRFHDNYMRVSETLSKILADKTNKLSDERKSVLRGYLRKMGQFETLLALKLAIVLFEPAELLAKALQGESFTASGAKQAADTLWKTSNEIGETEFNKAWKDAEERIELDLEMLRNQRPKIPPKRFETLESSDPAEINPKTRLRAKFVLVLDWLKNEIERRFHQPGMEQLIKLENVVLFPWQKSEPLTVQMLSDALGVHSEDFDVDMLAAQLRLCPNALQGIQTPRNVRDIAAGLRNLSEDCRRMLRSRKTGYLGVNSTSNFHVM